MSRDDQSRPGEGNSSGRSRPPRRWDAPPPIDPVRRASNREGVVRTGRCGRCGRVVLANPLTGELMTHRIRDEINAPWCEHGDPPPMPAAADEQPGSWLDFGRRLVRGPGKPDPRDIEKRCPACDQTIRLMASGKSFWPHRTRHGDARTPWCEGKPPE